MARLRNISDDERLCGPTGETVPADGLVEVPDDVFEQYGWPESIWKVTAESTDTKKKG